MTVWPPGAHLTPLQIPDGPSLHLLPRVKAPNQGQTQSVVLTPWGSGSPPLRRIQDRRLGPLRRSEGRGPGVVPLLLARRGPDPLGRVYQGVGLVVPPACRPRRSSRNPASRAKGPTAPAQSRPPSYDWLCGGAPRDQRALTWARGFPPPRASKPLALPRGSPRHDCVRTPVALHADHHGVKFGSVHGLDRARKRPSRVQPGAVAHPQHKPPF